MGVKHCIVSFKDTHAVEVEAESLYEAVALAFHIFNDHGYAPAPATEISIEVKPPSVVHTTTLNRVTDWIATSAKSPKDTPLKERLKELMASMP